MRCLPEHTPPTLPLYGFWIDLSTTKIWLCISVVLKTCPGLPFAYRTTPKLLSLVYMALRDLAPRCSPFLFLPVPPYPLCFGQAKWLPDPLVGSAVARLRLYSWSVSSERSVPYPTIKQKATGLSRQGLNINSPVSPFLITALEEQNGPFSALCPRCTLDKCLALALYHFMALLSLRGSFPGHTWPFLIHIYSLSLTIELGMLYCIKRMSFPPFCISGLYMIVLPKE